MHPISSILYFASRILTFILIIILASYLAYYTFLIPIDVQWIIMASAILFISFEFFIVDILIVLYYRVYLPLLIFLDIHVVRESLSHKYSKFTQANSADVSTQKSFKGNMSFNSMKHSYLSYKVAKNIFHESSTAASQQGGFPEDNISKFILKATSIWPPQRFVNRLMRIKIQQRAAMTYLLPIFKKLLVIL